MKNTKHIILLYAMLVLLAGFFNPSEGKEFREITIGIDATWPPMEFKDAKGGFTGFDVELMRAVAAEEGFGIRFVNIPWDGIFAGLETGKYDAICSSVTITDERKRVMDFSDQYFISGQVIVVRSNGSKPSKIDELQGMNCGAYIASSGANMLSMKGMDIRTYDEIGPMFDDLASGVIDAVVIDLPVAAEYAIHNNRLKGKFEISSGLLDNEFYGVAIKKGNDKVLSMINSGLKKVMANGTYDKLIVRWFGKKYK